MPETSFHHGSVSGLSCAYLGWASLFHVLTLMLNTLLWHYATDRNSDFQDRAIRALSGLLFVALYSQVKHPNDQGIPDTAFDLAPVLPAMPAILLGLMLETEFQKLLGTFLSF